ncbi:MAG: 4Fe-4S single cluster domain-containing protein [Candidatus Hodarchaeota archaeon]
MTNKMDILLNIADVFPVSYSNGPGRRTVIWIQGCTLKCPGCFNQEFQPHIKRYLVDPGDFANRITNLCKFHQCEGITITGGEPFQQSRALCEFIESIKKEGLSITVFSGYKYHELIRSKEKYVRVLLQHIDLLIAGPFNHTVKYNRTWFDDPDKELIYLTDIIQPKMSNDSKNENDLEIILEEATISVTGFPEKHDYDVLKDILKTCQIKTK